MAIIDIKSTNPNISWVIFKNPTTQESEGKPFSKTLRKGNLYGWYTSPQDYRLWFKEGDGQSSFYKNLDNNYLNQSAYNCPFVYCSMMAEALASTIKKLGEKDTECENTIILSSVLITQPSVADFFIHFFANKVNIAKKQLGNKVYELTFKGNVSLYYLTNLAQVFCLIQSIEDKNIYIDMTPNALSKYAHNLKAIEAPYFIVYLFLSRCVEDREGFKVVQPILQKQGWSLVYGNTQTQRFEAIKKFIQGGKELQDIGCGELYYTRHFAPRYEKVFAWDMDESIQTRNAKFLEKKSIFNVELKSGFTDEDVCQIKEGQDILITEMLEHIEKTKAQEILQQLKKSPFRRMIITVPNRDFNQFYQLSHQFRHDDHLWEPNFEEIESMMKNIFENDEFTMTIRPIGDGVNGIHVSTLIVVDKKSSSVEIAA